MVQSLPGFLDLCLDVCSPSQVLGDVYAEVLEAAYSLHRGPTDHKRSVGQQVSLLKSTISSLVLLTFRETVCPGTMMLVSPPHPSMRSHHCWNEAQNHSIISKFDNRCGICERTHSHVCRREYSRGLRTQPCGAPTFRVMEFEVYWPTFTTWGLPVRKSWIQSQSEVFRPRPVSLLVSLVGTMVLKAEL